MVSDRGTPCCPTRATMTASGSAALSSALDDRFSHVPTWDGQPQTFPGFQDEIELYLLGSDMDVKVSLAARISQKLKGAPRRVALSMKRDLFPKDLSGSESDGQGGRRPKRGTRTNEEANRLGIKRLVDKLKSQLQPGKQDLKGEKMVRFFGSSRGFRRKGQRMLEHNTFFEQSLFELEELGVTLDEDVKGFFYVQSAALTPERRERLLAAVGSDGYPFTKLIAASSRLFKDIHTNERSERRPVNEVAPPPQTYSPPLPEEDPYYDDDDWTTKTGIRRTTQNVQTTGTPRPCRPVWTTR